MTATLIIANTFGFLVSTLLFVDSLRPERKPEQPRKPDERDKYLQGIYSGEITESYSQWIGWVQPSQPATWETYDQNMR